VRSFVFFFFLFPHPKKRLSTEEKDSSSPLFLWSEGVLIGRDLCFCCSLVTRFSSSQIFHRPIACPPTTLSTPSPRLLPFSSMSVYEEVEIEDMEWDATEKHFTYPCPCGDRFIITLVSKAVVNRHRGVVIRGSQSMGDFHHSPPSGFLTLPSLRPIRWSFGMVRILPPAQAVLCASE